MVLLLGALALASSIVHPAGRPGQVQTLFRGETLRGLLLNAYGWSQVAMYALYTAIGLRDAARVEQIGARLKSLRDEGKLPGGAYRSLESIIAESREQKWEDFGGSLRGG